MVEMKLEENYEEFQINQYDSYVCLNKMKYLCTINNFNFGN